MTIQEEARDYKVYLNFLKFIKISYPVNDSDRITLEKRIKDEYELIKEKKSVLPAQFRRVISRIIEMNEARQKACD